MACYVLTGATAGLGLTLIERLVNLESNGHFIVIARNIEKAQKNFIHIEAKLKLNGGKLSVVHGDHGSCKTLFAAAKEIKQLTDRIDYLILNAGTMGKCSLNYYNYAIAFLTLKVFAALTCDATKNVNFEPQKTQDGYEFRFQTNCLSHYILVNELSSLLDDQFVCTPLSKSSVAWTSSSAGKADTFSIQDIQCFKGDDPYGSSKWSVNLASIVLSRKLKIKSSISDPGTFMTAGITGQLTWLPLFFLFSYFMALLRPFIPDLTLTTENASESHIHIRKIKDSLQPAQGGKKYASSVSLFRNRYIIETEVQPDPAQLSKFEQEIEQMYKKEQKLAQN